MKSFWVSWYGDLNTGFELNSPWWQSGYRDDQPTICAAIRAVDEDASKKAVAEAHDAPVNLEWRFVEERESNWSPFSGRFPKAEWMQW